jgi:DnaJ-like protein
MMGMGVQQDYYQVLGVGRTATDDELKHAYRSLARQLHPDVNKSPDATERFMELNQAYHILINPQRRARYDALRYYTPPSRPANPSYWSPPRPTYHTPYRTDTPPYDEPFAPRRRRTYSRQSSEAGSFNILRWIWLPLLLSRMCTLSSADWSSLWTTANLIAFINNWLPAIVVIGAVIAITVAVALTIRWWRSR